MHDTFRYSTCIALLFTITLWSLVMEELWLLLICLRSFLKSSNDWSMGCAYVFLKRYCYFLLQLFIFYLFF